ncbi:MAG: thioredoxin-disulfide reductase [Butyribacter sp.]|nr:thioredoxin-disulfide reductase [bacterium]MDY3854959.1 thioredoxin-disulfide reductase [Butyribacter sp.]
MYDIIIVGAGTAGLSAAIYSLRAGKSVLVLEQQPSYGGQIVNASKVENYPGIPEISGFEFAKSLYEQAVGLGAEVIFQKVIRIEEQAPNKVVCTEKDSWECKSIILATGAKKRPLGVPGEETFAGKGVSYCATCDGMFFRGKEVAVAGGGNTALEDANFLANYCSKVTVIHRRDTFRGDKKSLMRLQAKQNVTFLLDSEVVELLGENMLSGIKVRNKKNGKVTEVPVSGLFIAVGQMPDSEVFSDQVETDQLGYIVANEDCKTNKEGIFVAGDCRTKTVRQLTTAASDGAIAGIAACEWCDGK